MIQPDTDLTPVNSTNILAVGWVANVLTVQFRSGTEFTYQPVTQEVFEGLLSAPSPGRYFANNIKGAYQSQQIR